MERSYLCIDLKSFYASVECVERGLDPMTTNLVVADPDREKGTLCLAVSPSLKALGVKNRCRVYEIPAHLDYIMAPPRMQKYIDYAAEIYGEYLRYISPDDIHVYSIDEAFFDVTPYLAAYNKTPKEMAQFLMGRVAEKTGVRATAGVGTNLYLCKIALDITAKHAKDFIGELTEESYCRTLWDHRPLTDFWRIGPGIQRRLERMGMPTMRAVAHGNEDRLYEEFGIDAELLIDHAWGRESATMADIKRYHSKSHSINTGQVLLRDYTPEEALIIVKEMADVLSLDMVKKKVRSDTFVLYVGYSNGGPIPSRGGTVHLNRATNSDRVMVAALAEKYLQVVDKGVPVRRIGITAANLQPDDGMDQLSFFDGEEELERDKTIQETVLSIKERFGQNAILKGMNYQEAATTRERNHQIGGHKSGE